MKNHPLFLARTEKGVTLHNMEAAIIESEAMKLPKEELAVLVDRLQEKLSTRRTSYLDEHLSESRERFDAYKRGEISSVDLTQRWNIFA